MNSNAELIERLHEESIIYRGKSLGALAAGLKHASDCYLTKAELIEEAISALEAIEAERSAMKQSPMSRDIANMIEAGGNGPDWGG